MRIAYFDCFSGAAGNMILGALLDAGLDPQALEEGLRRLDLGDWEMKVTQVTRNTIGGLYVEFLVGGASADHPTTTHGHGHQAHHSHGHHPPHGHEHGAEAPPRGDHGHAHGPGEPPQGVGSLADILARIRGAGLPEPVEEASCRTFQRLAEAEARVHRTTAAAVHFHEVGAMDAILDVVGASLGLHLLGIEQVFASPLPQGHGFVRAAHGALPVPAPATACLLHGAPLRFVDVPGELVTPTGAALLTTLARFEAPPVFRPEAVGYGAGRSRYDHPNLLRLFLGTREEPATPAPRGSLPSPDAATICEADLDDCNPQLLGPLMDQLLGEGAWDVHFCPIQMKKGRPGVKIQVLAPAALTPRLADLILEETTTLGVRWHPVERKTLEREEAQVSTPYGPIRVKRSGRGRTLHRAPEFEDCREAARAAQVPTRRVYEEALKAALSLPSDGDS